MDNTLPQVSAIPCPTTLREPLMAIVEALSGLRFGQLLIVVHDGAVVQIDRTERRRLERPQRHDGRPTDSRSPELH